MKLNYRLSTEAQARVLASGKNVQQEQSIDVDFETLTEEQRKLILQYCDLQKDTLKLKTYSADAYGLDELLAMFSTQNTEAEIERKKIEEEKITISKIEQIAAACSTESVKLSRYSNDYLYIEGVIKREYYFNNLSEFEAAAQNNFADQIEKYKASLSEHVEKEKQKQIESAAKEYGKELLKSWAYEHGSELLKARIQEGMNWLQLADDEYLQYILPAGCECLDAPSDDWTIKNATLEQITALREFRQSVFPQPGVVHGSIELVRYKYEDEYEKRHVDVIRFRMRSLSGTEKTFEKVLSEETIQEED